MNCLVLMMRIDMNHCLCCALIVLFHLMVVSMIY